MGTSKGMATPAGGGWTAVKKQVTKAIGGAASSSADRIVAGVISAAGGLGGGGGSGSTSVANAVSRLGSFGSGVIAGGLDTGLNALGLDSLRGKSALEVISKIAEHLADSSEGPHSDIISNALRDAVLECAALESDGEYDDLEKGLQSFLLSAGIEGLIESFLANFVFDRIWSWIESHSNDKSSAVGPIQALSSAVQSSCKLHVRQLIDEIKGEGRFEKVDWFGNQGLELGRSIISTLEFRLESLATEEAT